ncbi:hypothetical protein PN498_00035 [Oscillatoria sp. CS-180]|uniref:hypothetical protein n=1 Tax=Oscillatoria sp. CS-180 TaxID=3021720 RepID=UPI00232B3962|nr:hypothetical protein [Oscillatoria sp. CS-180]MDB9524358.1 hypothetical protein [Oscillatoria sp. CS-180]
MVTSASAPVKVRISFNDPDLDLSEREAEIQKLLPQLRALDEVNNVGRVDDPTPPESSKGFGFLLGLLQAEVSAENFKALGGFLSDRLLGKAIEMEVEANGKRLRVTASSQAELTAAIKAAQDFISD